MACRHRGYVSKLTSDVRSELSGVIEWGALSGKLEIRASGIKHGVAELLTSACVASKAITPLISKFSSNQSR